MDLWINIARESLEADGQPSEGAGLLVSVVKKVVDLLDDEPLLFHTGPRALFPLVAEAVARMATSIRMAPRNEGSVYSPISSDVTSHDVRCNASCCTNCSSCPSRPTTPSAA